MQEQSDIEITTSELREALKQLESEDVVSLAGDDRNPIVRLVS